MMQTACNRTVGRLGAPARSAAFSTVRIARSGTGRGVLGVLATPAATVQSVATLVVSNRGFHAVSVMDLGMVGRVAASSGGLIPASTTPGAARAVQQLGLGIGGPARSYSSTSVVEHGKHRRHRGYDDYLSESDGEGEGDGRRNPKDEWRRGKNKFSRKYNSLTFGQRVVATSLGVAGGLMLLTVTGKLVVLGALGFGGFLLWQRVSGGGPRYRKYGKHMSGKDCDVNGRETMDFFKKVAGPMVRNVLTHQAEVMRAAQAGKLLAEERLRASRTVRKELGRGLRLGALEDFEELTAPAMTGNTRELRLTMPVISAIDDPAKLSLHALVDVKETDTPIEDRMKGWFSADDYDPEASADEFAFQIKSLVVQLSDMEIDITEEGPTSVTVSGPAPKKSSRKNKGRGDDTIDVDWEERHDRK